jgi:hypothetical protein
MLLGLGCCHRGTATPCLVHHHLCDDDQLGGREQQVALRGTATVFGGTATSRAVST